MDKPLTWNDTALSLVHTFAPWLLTIFLLWLAQKLLEDEFKEALNGFVRELKSLAKLEWSLKSLNAAIIVFALLIVVVSPKSLTTPVFSGQSSSSESYEGWAYAAYFLAFGVLGLLCLQIVKHEK